MWFLYSIVAFLFWSGSDFFSKVGSPQSDKRSHWKMIVTVGTVMGLHALFSIFFQDVNITFRDVLLYLPASLCYIGSMLLGYIGLRYIELSISSPICNCSGAVVAVLCFFFLQEMPALWQWIGVACIGVGLLSLGLTEHREDDEARALRQAAGVRYTRSAVALLLPILYCVIDALGTFVDCIILRDEDTGSALDRLFPTPLAEETANVCYELTFFAMALCTAAFLLACRRREKAAAAQAAPADPAACETVPAAPSAFFEAPSASFEAPAVSFEAPAVSFEAPSASFFGRTNAARILAALCETAGQFAYVFAIGNTENAGFAAAIISAYCAMSVLLSRFFLHEKLSRAHYFSILLAFAGIVILGVFDV